MKAEFGASEHTSINGGDNRQTIPMQIKILVKDKNISGHVG